MSSRACETAARTSENRPRRRVSGWALKVPCGHMTGGGEAKPKPQVPTVPVWTWSPLPEAGLARFAGGSHPAPISSTGHDEISKLPA